MTELPDKQALTQYLAQHRNWPPGPPPGVTPEPVGEGEESVWDFPRPPRLEPVAHTLKVVFAGQVIAETTNGHRMCETAGAPVYLFPPEDVQMAALKLIDGKVSVCEWKGACLYYDLELDGKRSAEAAFTYPDPIDDLDQGYEKIGGHIAFYASRVDAAFIGDEQVTPQPGGFYAGWVTKNLRGPIKGAPGSNGW
ncbi:MAG: DUF427 domain-containing protein [Pseudomonadota bacterium]